MERVFQGSVPAMVTAAARGLGGALVSVAALLFATDCLARTFVDPITDCDRKPIEQVYGKYTYDEPRLRPVPGSWLSVKEVYGDYERIEISEGWMYLSDAKAQAYAGLEVSIEPSRFEKGDTKIVDPQYEVTCYRTFVEGHVPVYRWSDEQGFGSDRDVIDVLRVYRPEDTERLAPYIFEIVGDDLWKTASGWLFVVKRQGTAVGAQREAIPRERLGDEPGPVEAGAGSACPMDTPAAPATSSAANCPVEPTVAVIADCNERPVKEVYGSYVYDKPRLAPAASLRLTVEETYGDYKRIEPPQSLRVPTASDVQRYVGREVSIEPARFREGDSVIVNPRYEVTCYRTSDYWWSDVFGFGVDRDVIDVLRVYRPEDTSPIAPHMFEIVGDDLWRATISWLFVIRRKE